MGRTPHGVRGLKFGDGVGRHDDAGRTPHGVRGLKCCVCNIGVVVRLCFGVSCGICAGAIVLTSCPSVVAVAVASRPGRPTRRAVAVTWRRGFCVAVVRLRHADGR